MTLRVSERKTPVAQYIRMSTDHQRYSLDNQRAAIQAYAEANNCEIVAAYEDAGKSGITLKGRAGLTRLLHDVTSTDRPFSTILTLDVSRWGRFQDPDQHGAYEFLCRQVGVKIEYVGESFSNDGSIGMALLKNLKRTMAAEYSRDLSRKCTRANFEVARRGFKMGGVSIYGFRRVLIDENGVILTELKSGDRKCLSSDRVHYVHGPTDEIKVIRRVFAWFIHRRHSVRHIAELLNRDPIAKAAAPWGAWRVRHLLTCELAIGNYIYGKTSRKLGGPVRKVPPAKWVRVPMLSPIISLQRFERAAELLQNGQRRYSKEKLIKALQRLVLEKGNLTTRLIGACPYLPGFQTLQGYFGGMSVLCKLAGFDPSSVPRPVIKHVSVSREDMIAGMQRIFREYGRITRTLINSAAGLPDARCIAQEFGSIAVAYSAADVKPSKHSRKLLGSWRANLNDLTEGYHKKIFDAEKPLALGDAELVAAVRRLFDENGYISMDLIEADERLPSLDRIRKRYKSILHLYQKAGITYTRAELSALSLKVRNSKFGSNAA